MRKDMFNYFNKILPLWALCFTIIPFAMAQNHYLDFDGVDDYAENPAQMTTSLEHFTLEAWVYHRTLPATIQRYVTVGREVAVIRHAGSGQLQIYFRLDYSSQDIFIGLIADNALEAEKWYHVAGTWDGIYLKLYLNGELVEEKNVASAVMATPDGSVMLSRPTEPMDGFIDDVRIWNTARTQSEILAKMHLELLGTEPGLENYWKLNEQFVLAALDSTVNSVDLTLYNMGLEDWVPFEFDFGDAPAPYPTLLVENGPHHGAIGPRLGAARDIESDGIPTPGADGDGADDDGISLWTDVVRGKLDAVVTVNVQGGSAKLDAWVDWNGDGDWTDLVDQIANNLDLSTGNNRVTFDVPGSAVPGNTFARFRLSSASNIGITGMAHDGEVEDVQIRVDSCQFNLLMDVGSTGSLESEDIFAADMDGDGDMDVLMLNGNAAVYLFENDGSQSFTPHLISNPAVWGENQDVYAVDMDGDFDLDVLFLRPFSNAIVWLENIGSLTFTTHSISTGTDFPYNICPVDMDSDDDMDLLVVTTNPGKVVWYENDGGQTFSSHLISTCTSTAATPYALM